MLRDLVKNLKPSSTLLINETSRNLEEQGRKIFKFGFGQSPFKVPEDVVDELKKNGFLIIGLTGDAQVSISSFNEKGPFVVIVGAENKGISLLTQKNCDYMIKIPLRGKTPSLNASVAAAISLCYLSNKEFA